MAKQIYICSPLAGDIDGNLEKAKAYCKDVAGRGYIPICPHLYFSSFLDDTNPKDREWGKRLALEWLDSFSETDQLWIFGGVISEGMRVEINLANAKGLEIKAM